MEETYCPAGKCNCELFRIMGPKDYRCYVSFNHSWDVELFERCPWPSKIKEPKRKLADRIIEIVLGNPLFISSISNYEIFKESIRNVLGDATEVK